MTTRTGIQFPTDVSRIAVAGDWHGNTRWAVFAIREAAKRGAHVIVHTGDFGYTFEPDFLRTVEHAAGQHNVIVMFIDGNHEAFDWLLAQPVSDDGVRRLTDRIWHLPRGFRWQWGELSFLALGGAPSVDRPWRTPGVSWWPQEQITPMQAHDAASAGHADVMVTHDCPAGVPLPWIEGNPFGFEVGELRAADRHRDLLATVVDAVRPSHLWHGHYHRRHSATRPNPDGSLCRVLGLNCDGTTISNNIEIVDLSELKQAVR